MSGPCPQLADCPVHAEPCCCLTCVVAREARPPARVQPNRHTPACSPQVRVTNADVGLLVAGSDFVTLSGLVLQTSEPRGIQAAEGLAGHLGLWVQQSSNVLVNE